MLFRSDLVMEEENRELAGGKEVDDCDGQNVREQVRE